MVYFETNTAFKVVLNASLLEFLTPFLFRYGIITFKSFQKLIWIITIRLKKKKKQIEIYEKRNKT